MVTNSSCDNSIAVQMYENIHMCVVLGVIGDANFKPICSNILRTNKDKR